MTLHDAPELVTTKRADAKGVKTAPADWLNQPVTYQHG